MCLSVLLHIIEEDVNLVFWAKRIIKQQELSEFSKCGQQVVKNKNFFDKFSKMFTKTQK